MTNHKYPIIDPHVHAWKRYPRYPWANETARPPERDGMPEMLLELMRANGVAYRDAQEQVKRPYDAFGPERLTWGTDWPMVEAHCGYGKALAMVRDEMKFLNDGDKTWMLSGTVERVWKFS
jgi:predicted TIM-barrel fold metal-dependent hydrolase